jgi:hypothetical protein
MKPNRLVQKTRKFFHDPCSRICKQPAHHLTCVKAQACCRDKTSPGNLRFAAGRRRLP